MITTIAILRQLFCVFVIIKLLYG